ncbi:hypothetical protein B9479_004033 [Cryptococcus floricola]|uniref:Sorting nexin MVP1 n=1 Tax=Cryptococcus floricola TaxID=2591691 RepID=A0A5D3AZ43_9TREE|nr:hypothetical protein B9479_004033 [Cryptococcus floricola]
MFNNPRPLSPSSPPHSYDPLSFTGFSNGLPAGSIASGSVTGAASGGGDELDPWSSAPSPSGGSRPASTLNPSPTRFGAGSEALQNLIVDPPAQYLAILDQLPPGTTVTSLSKYLSDTLPAPIIAKIVTLTNDQPSSPRSSLVCALALVALAQASHISDPLDLSIEILSSALSQGDLPPPKVSHPGSFSPAKPTSHHSSLGPDPYPTWDTPSQDRTGYTPPSSLFRHPPVMASDSSVHIDDPYAPDPLAALESQNGGGENPGQGSGGLRLIQVEDLEPEDMARPRGWWKDLERVTVDLIPEKEGWFLQKYRLSSTKRGDQAVTRRFSDFLWLADILSKRYPYRLLPPIPPKRLNPDAAFLEARRLSLQRLLSSLTSHPVLSQDPCLTTFLTLPSPGFEGWRKRTSVALEEEGPSSPSLALRVPRDLEPKLLALRSNLPQLLSNLHKLITLYERALTRAQAEKGDSERLAGVLEGLGGGVKECCFWFYGAPSSHVRNGINGDGNSAGESGDAPKYAKTGDVCEVCGSLGTGVGDVAKGYDKVVGVQQKRIENLQKHLESLRSQRDLHLALHALFSRWAKTQAANPTSSLLTKISSLNTKSSSLLSSPPLPSAPPAKRSTWESQLSKLRDDISLARAEVEVWRGKEVWMKALMWEEVAKVWHGRQGVEGGVGWRALGAGERGVGEGMEGVWEGVVGALEGVVLE